MRHRFNPRKRVNDYQRYSMLAVLPLTFMSCTLGNIHIRSKLQATIILAGITIHWALRKIFWKKFCVSDDDKCYDEKMSWPKIIKISNLIQAIKNSVCPKAKVIRRPNFSESRICPNIYRMFRKCGLNTRHDNREVTLIHLTRAQTLRSDICSTGSIHGSGSMTINAIPC